MDAENSPNFGKNALEWAVFALGTVLVGATLFYLASRAISAPNTPPEFRIEFGASREMQNARVLEVRIENSGQTTARDVEIEVKTRRENAVLRFDFVPRQGQNSGFVVLQKPFERNELRAQIKSFAQ